MTSQRKRIALGSIAALSVSVAVLFFAMSGPQLPPVPGAAGSHELYYDAAGQLVGVSDPDGDAARYQYDAGGNLLSTDRFPSDELSIMSVVPSMAPPGATVEIAGTGFSSWGSDEIWFTGASAPAQERESEQGRIRVKVPDDAEDGPITIKTGDGEAESQESFLRGEARKVPEVTKLSTDSADPGDTLTITGTGFDTGEYRTSVMFHRTQGKILEISKTTLTVEVPESAGSGPVSVRTPNGVAVTDSDFVIAPRDFEMSELVDGGRVAVDGDSVTTDVPQEKNGALVRFEGRAGDKLSIGISGGSTGFSQAAIMMYTPYVSAFARLDFDSPLWLSKDGASGYALPPLPTDGIYQVVIRPDGGPGGKVTTTVSSTQVGEAATDDKGEELDLDRDGRFAQFSFEATAGEWFNLGFSGVDPKLNLPYAVFEQSDAQVVNSQVIHPANGKTPDAEPAGSLRFQAFSTGTYRLEVGVENAGRTDGKVWISSEVDGGELEIGGTAGKAKLSRPGQMTRFTFTGEEGQEPAVKLSDVGFDDADDVEVEVLAADGEPVQTSGKGNGISISALPADGEYTLLVSAGRKTGSTGIALTGTGGHNDLATADPADPAEDTAAEDPGWQPGPANLDGRDWESGYGDAPNDTSELTAPKGTTGITGRVLTIAGEPLANVTVTADSVTSTTDDKGRFLLSGVSAGRRVIHVDGSTADGYAGFDIGVDTTEGQTHRLPYSVFLPKIDRDTAVKIDSPTTQDVTLTTPAIPGLEVRIPKGTTVRGTDGKPVDELTITPIPLDRPPFPLPTAQVPTYFTVQPGGGYLFPEGAQVIYPNYTHQAPGTRMDFWSYDPEGKGWDRYGEGQVSDDGTQVVPDPDVKFYRFTGVMTKVQDKPPPDASPNEGAPPTADPVDPSTGLMVSQTTDLFLDDVIPVELSRVYQQGDGAPREFGVGNNFSYDYYPWSPGQIEEFEYEEVDLYSPSGSTVHYDRDSPGEGLGGFASALFKADATTSQFEGSTMTWNGHGWDVHMRDGMTYVLGDEAPLQGIRDPYGNTLTIDRELKSPGEGIAPRPYGPVHQITSPNGKWIKFTYNDEKPAQVTEVSDNLGRTVSYDYNDDGYLTSVTDPAGNTTGYKYDKSGRLKTITDARGEKYLTNSYDKYDRVVEQTIADQGTYKWKYSGGEGGTAEKTKFTDPEGNVRFFNFNGKGQVVYDIPKHGTNLAEATKTEYDDTGTRVLATVDPLGRRTEYGYDSGDLLAEVTTLAGTKDARRVSFERNGPFGQVNKYTDSFGAVTEFSYDSHGGLTEVTDPLGNQTKFTLNDAGQVTGVTDAKGRTSTVDYQFGDPVTMTDPLGRISHLRYDAAGRLIEAMDPTHSATLFGYDVRDQVTKVTDPLGRITSLGYDEVGNQSSIVDSLGNETVIEHDASGRPVSVTDPLGGVETFAYDGNGNLAKRTSPGGIDTVFSYDELTRLSKIRYGATEDGEESSTEFGYDLAGRLVSTKDSLAGTTKLGYDDLDRIVSEHSQQGDLTYGYDVKTPSRSVSVDGELVATYDYDAAGALVDVGRDGEELARIERDELGRTDVVGGETDQHYVYDSAGQVSAIAYRQDESEFGRIEYSYDAAGRPTFVTGDNAQVMIPDEFGPAKYDAAHRMTELGDTEISYDADGNLVDDGTSTYSWDARGQLAELKSDGLKASFGYDAGGRRTTKTIGDTTTDVLYDGLNPLQESQDGKVSATQISGGLDRFLVRETADASYQYLTDLTGSTIGLADDSGELPTSYAYEPYGSPAIGGQDPGNPYQFTGREEDGTGLMQYRARYYSPESGRFASSDPIGFAAGDTNLYSYVFNQPTVLTDPMGTDPGSGTQTGSGDPAGGGGEQNCSIANSFTGDTEVVMADGSRKAIADVELGDEVLSTDPETEETGGREVTALIEGKGEKQLVDISVDTDDDGTGDDQLTATDGHPFWVASDMAWRDAKDLKPGDLLRTSSGTYVQITAVDKRTEQTTVNNLTVEDLHTYYVGVGGEDVLVHNCGKSKLKEGEQYVYRAVKDEELKQLLNTRRFQNMRGIESKYFSSTPEGAALYARSAYANFPGEGPYTLVRGVIRTERIPVESRIEHLSDGGRGGIDAFALWEDAMSTIGRVRILPSMPIP